MTRFASLEFDHTQEPGDSAEVRAREMTRPEERQTTTREVRDERFYVRAGDEHYQRARFEPALRMYSRALESNPNYDPAWVGQVRMLLEMGEFKEARVWADRGLEVFRDHAELLAAKGVLAARLGDRKKSLEFTDSAAAAKESGRPYVWLARGEVLLATRRRNGSVCLDRARSAAGSADWFTALLVARIYYFYRQYARGLATAREATEIMPTAPFPWFVAGLCQQSLGMGRRARGSFRQALELDPDFEPARKALGSWRPANWLTTLLGPFRRILN